MSKNITPENCQFHNNKRVIFSIEGIKTEKELRIIIDNFACRWCKIMLGILTYEQIQEMVRQMKTGELPDNE